MSARELRISEYNLIMREADAHGGPTAVDLACRELCLVDLFYLLAFALNRVDVRKSDWLYDRCVEVQQEPDGMIDLWAREHYKDLADDTPMFTTNGWTTHGELQTGDEVFSPAGVPVQVIALSERFNDSICYRLTFSDGAEIVAGAGHLWSIREKHRGRVQGQSKRRVWFSRSIVKTEDIAAMLSSGERVDVGVSDPLIFPLAELPVQPYTMGAWLGDGHSAGARITIHADDSSILERIEDDGYSITDHKSGNENVRLCQVGKGVKGNKTTGLTAILRKAGVIGNKHIPQPYLESSVDQRMDLLRGLMDTDGHCNSRGTATFCNQNERLVGDVHELALHLGLQPKTRKYQGKNKPYWQVSFQAHTDRNPFHLKRKADRAIPASHYRGSRTVVSVEVADSVPTRCIQVDGGMYLAGKQMVPTHNSTIITFAKTIQDILANPSETVGLFSHTKPIARAFLRQIKYEFETNSFLQRIFPDILYADPKKEAPAAGNNWSEDKGITVKRPSNPKESTIEAHGLVDGQPTSKHFSLLVYDDVVTLESITSPEMIQKTTDALALSYNLGAHGGRRRFIGTRYHFADTYKTIIDRGTAEKRVYAATDDGTVSGRPVFLSAEVNAEKRRDMGPYVYGCQMLQDPISESAQSFQEQWIQWYTSKPAVSALNVYLLVDPAGSKKKTSDYSVFWVVGLGADQNYYVLHGIRRRMNLRERTDTLFALHREWKPLGVGYEHFGMQADIEHIEEKMESVTYRFKITSLSGNTPKVDRIKRLQPKFEMGRFLLPRFIAQTGQDGRITNLIDEFLDEEYKTFPVCVHDDMLDDLANILHPDLQTEFPEHSSSPLYPIAENPFSEPIDCVIGF